MKSNENVPAKKTKFSMLLHSGILKMAHLARNEKQVEAKKVLLFLEQLQTAHRTAMLENLLEISEFMLDRAIEEPLSAEEIARERFEYAVKNNPYRNF